MKPKDLDELFKSHGGVKEVHTRPVLVKKKMKWCNTMVCKDGYVRTNTAREDFELNDYWNKKEN